MTWPVLLVLAVLTFLWAGPVTGASGQVEQTFRSTLNSLTGGADEGQRSSDASYAIVGGEKQSAEKRLRDFRNQAIESTAADRVTGANYPLAELDRTRRQSYRPTSCRNVAGWHRRDGRAEPVDHERNAGRAAPIWLQLCIAVGFVAVARRCANGFRPSLEFLCGAVACVAAIALQVLLPELSVDYGILRAFGQGLFWLAPFLAVGSIQAFRWLGRSRARTAALAAAVAFYLSLTGVIPQLFGGYPPQLHLNNAGEVLRQLLSAEQEASAIKWLQTRIATEKTPDVQAHLYCYVYAFTPRQQYAEPSDGDDIFPVFVRRDAYAFLGYTTVQKDDVAISFAGDTVTYKYPVQFLDANKSLIYSSNGARIYR